ncbi:zinc ABC transporter substrate-binding protein [Fodinicurvata halophila]|uniref:High-affinity zinc uptake system protein ZnuA n=1 Tax=Fodinicurvata halophila TaxID=1419723 RepID=A0ABV8UPR0_9PROT
MQTLKNGLFGGVLAGAFLVSGAAGAQAAPSVVTTIQPVHSLVSAVMEGVATPELLVESGGSPHSYSLRPSQARALEQADAIVWVGEGLETFLQRPLEALGTDARLVTLSELPDVQLLETRSGGSWDDHAHGPEGHASRAGNDSHGHDGETHDHAHHHEDGHHDEADEHEHHDHDEAHRHDGAHDQHDEGGHGNGHVHGSLDMHIWLAPDNARAILTGVRDALSELDPGNSERYEANTQAALEEVDSLETELQSQLAEVVERPYIVFHDAYHYFEEAFGLNAVGAVSLNPARQPSARRMAELREKVEQLDAVCVFREPQFEPRLVASLVQGTSVQTGELDPLGVGLEPGPQAYFELMRSLGDDISACLRGNG